MPKPIRLLAAVAAATAVMPAAAVAAGPPADVPVAPMPPHSAPATNPAPAAIPPVLPSGEPNPGVQSVPEQLPTGDRGASATERGSERAASVVRPDAGAKAKAKAYGPYCKAQSKKPAGGQKRSAFSLCVTAVAKVAAGQTDNPRTACKALSRKRVAGQRGTPFSLCVSSSAKYLAEEDVTPVAEDAPATSEQP